jgi:hypothetical protein
MCRFAGEGTVAVNSYRKDCRKALPVTPFENLAIFKAVKDARLGLVKVAATPSNAELAKKYNVGVMPALVICAPGGEALTTLSGPQFTMAALTTVLKNLHPSYAAWKKTHAAK